MSDATGSGITSDGRYSFTYSINPISSDVQRNVDYPQCPPIQIDNYKALITLTPANLNSASTIIYHQPSSQSIAVPTQSIARRISVVDQAGGPPATYNLAYALPTQSVRRMSVGPQAITAQSQQQCDESGPTQSQPTYNLAYALPTRRTSIVDQQSQSQQPLNLAYALPSQSIHRVSVTPQQIPQQQPTQSVRRISVVQQQEPQQTWAIASNNSFETVNNSGSNIYLSNN